MFNVVALVLLFPAVAFGQRLSHPVMASRDDLFHEPRPFLAVPDTVDVLAVMVQFQIDDDVTTTGNGQFDLSTTSDPIIDPPPHNGQYFRDHLTFLENYYARASDGKQIVRTTLIDTTFTLTGVMEDYSPQRNETNEKLTDLATETWGLVDASGQVSDFSAYECFFIFHAGTGRDIDLVSLFGFDPTPRDIPSIFLGPAAFREVYGQDFPGIVVNNGQDTIRNSGILPETESRLIPTITGDVLLELSFNGLLSASVGSYLGLPDLFNTSTGLSAIGRFGLMDGQSIFSFLGVFPPEPSAWEKYYLGWIAPIAIGESPLQIRLPATGLSSQDSVYQVVMTPAEYFLIENRQRDPLKNGQTVTSSLNGVPMIQSFSRDTTGFNQFDISALSGVVTDVEDLDWSLPGGVDQDGNRLDGGILIWHIDESIIRDEIRTNTVNADPNNRGVDLEEADGSQDIGQEYGFLSAGSGSEEGTPLDFWFDGNPVPVFENEFSSSSHPSSHSNSGANSLITVNQFSVSGATMTASVMLGDELTLPLDGFPKSLNELLPIPSLTVGPFVNGGTPLVITSSSGNGIPVYDLEGDSTAPAPVPGKVFGWTASGTPGMSGGRSSGQLIEGATMQGGAFLETGVALRDLDGDGFRDVIVGQGMEIGTTGGGATAHALRAFTPADTDGDSLAEPLFETQVPRALITSPVSSDSLLAVGAAGGILYLFRFDGTIIDSVAAFPGFQDEIAGVSVLFNPYTILVTGSGGRISVISRSPSGSVVDPDAVNVELGKPIAGPAAAWSSDAGAEVATVAISTTDGTLFLLLIRRETGFAGHVAGFPVSTNAPCTAPPALADIDQDGQRDVVVFSGGQISVYNVAGALLDNFPATVASGDLITSHPVVADVDGDSDLDIIAVTESGLVTAFDRSGASASGFPLQAGAGRQSVAVFQIPGPSLEMVDVGVVVASSADGSVTAWKTGQILANAAEQRLPWPQYQRDDAKSGLSTESIDGVPVGSGFFPEDRVYNWPNPVYDDFTHIRFFVGEEAGVSIKIFDMAGDLVSELTGPARGGVDNEIVWDVRDIQSGVYFARVEATGATRNGSAIIKIAVVK